MAHFPPHQIQYHEILFPSPSGVYSSTNLTSVYQRSKLDLKLGFETEFFKLQYKKVIKNCLDCMERGLFILFFTFRSHQCAKSPHKKKDYSPENETCECSRRLFLPYFFWIKLWCQFSHPVTLTVGDCQFMFLIG